jgi:hypothetical protein
MDANEMDANGMDANGMDANGMGTNEMDANEMGANEMDANEMGTNGIGTNAIRDAESLLHWTQSDLLRTYMDILNDKNIVGDVNKLLTPTEKHTLAQFIIPLDAVYERKRQNDNSRDGGFPHARNYHARNYHARNYHHGLHSNLTIYQKIHDPFFRIIKYLQNDRLLFFDTLAILTDERMEIVEHSRNDTQPLYTEFMGQFFHENGTAQAMYAAATLANVVRSAPLVYAAVAARVVLLSWIGAFAEIKKLVAGFQLLYKRVL